MEHISFVDCSRIKMSQDKIAFWYSWIARQLWTNTWSIKTPRLPELIRVWAGLALEKKSKANWPLKNITNSNRVPFICILRCYCLYCKCFNNWTTCTLLPEGAWLQISTYLSIYLTKTSHIPSGLVPNMVARFQGNYSARSLSKLWKRALRTWNHRAPVC